MNPDLLSGKNPGTLPGAFAPDPPADKNFTNKEIEWLVKKPPGTFLKAEDGVVAYGLMLRVSEEHPQELPQNAWWNLEKMKQLWKCNNEALKNLGLKI